MIVLKITLKNLIKFWLIILVFLSLSISQVMADRMGSDSYEFVFTNINMGGRTTGSPNYTLDMSLGQTVAKRWEENGYIVRAGFQYIHILYPFSFELSDTTLDFGTLIPGTPVTEQLTATITHRGQGYEVMVYQDHKLQTFDGNTWIEDTACDNPYCDADTAESWISSAVYGFGYNVTGHDVSAGFAAPRRQVRGIQPLSPQQGAQFSVLAPIGFGQNMTLVFRTEPATPITHFHFWVRIFTIHLRHFVFPLLALNSTLNF